MNVPKCNCDGCQKQENCEYGHVIYDEITRGRMSLFDKFAMVESLEFDVSTEKFGKIATIQELHDKRLLLKIDKNVLYNTLNYLQEMQKAYYAFGKCGRAYFNFMKMGDEISLVKEAIKEYDAYQKRVNQMAVIKTYIIDRLNKERDLLQLDLYKEFSGVERSWVTNAVRELVKENLIIREKFGKSYKIRKNNA